MESAQGRMKIDHSVRPLSNSGTGGWFDAVRGDPVPEHSDHQFVFQADRQNSGGNSTTSNGLSSDDRFRRRYAQTTMGGILK